MPLYSKYIKYIYYIADFRPSLTLLMTKMTNDVNDGILRRAEKTDEIWEFQDFVYFCTQRIADLCTIM